jgi:hypothetical protein
MRHKYTKMHEQEKLTNYAWPATLVDFIWPFNSFAKKQKQKKIQDYVRGRRLFMT